MTRTSEIMMNDTTGKVSVVGNKIRASGWYGSKGSSHTVQIVLSNFSGRIAIQGTLASEPKEDDWFFINLSNNNHYLTFETDKNTPIVTQAYNFKGNFIWLRALMDRNNLDFEPSAEQLRALGNVNKILLSR